MRPVLRSGLTHGRPKKLGTPVCLHLKQGIAAMTTKNGAIAFLREYGHTSLVNLGAGRLLNRIDNHIRLMTQLNLTYYVAITVAHTSN